MARQAQSSASDAVAERPPVFIIGGSRTGSEMLKTMLSESPDLDFVDELFLLCPRWLHKDLATNIREHVGDLGAPEALDRLMDLLYSGRPYGWIWSVAGDWFPRQRLRERLAARPLSLSSLLDALMTVHAERNGKRGRGAKFPTHYSYTDRLLDWYPDCRLIHTTRDPRAVYASQANKYLKEGDALVRRAWMKSRQFVHINVQVSWTARLHRRLAGRENYRLVRYEDVVREPERTLRELCAFLGVEFVPKMLETKQYGSSYRPSGGRGVHDTSLQAWRANAGPLSTGLIRVLHARAWKVLGLDDTR